MKVLETWELEKIAAENKKASAQLLGDAQLRAGIGDGRLHSSSIAYRQPFGTLPVDLIDNDQADSVDYSHAHWQSIVLDAPNSHQGPREFADDAEPLVFAIGATVQAADRDNFGEVDDFDSETAWVLFWNKRSGASKIVELPRSFLTVVRNAPREEPIPENILAGEIPSYGPPIRPKGRKPLETLPSVLEATVGPNAADLPSQEGRQPSRPGFLTMAEKRALLGS